MDTEYVGKHRFDYYRPRQVIFYMGQWVRVILNRNGLIYLKSIRNAKAVKTVRLS